MFKHVLVALDGSPEAERAVTWAQRIAPAARLVLVHVTFPVSAGGPPGSGVPLMLFEDRSEDYLRQIARRYHPMPVMVRRVGTVAGCLLRQAVEQRCDLICLLGHGGRPLERRVLGGTTERLLHGARVPILIVPATAAPEPADVPIRRIGVPLDGSASTEAILRVASELGHGHGAELVLLHALADNGVRPTGGEGVGAAGLPAGLVARLESLAQGLIHQGVQARAVLGRGAAPGGILELAHEAQADLLLLWVYGHGGVQHLLHGALASRLIQQADLPVLAVRHDILPPSGAR